MNMKKSLLALTLTGAFVAPAAMAADVYGVMHASYDRYNDGSKTTAAKTNQLNSRESRLGFKGSEDVGNGMSAIWQIESDIGVDSGTGSLATRNTFLGLKTDGMGTVLIGKHDTPYKISTRKLDVFAETAADNRMETGAGAADPMNGLMGGGHDTRLANVLAYMSPAMGGFSVAAATVFGAENAAAGATKGSAFSIAGMFTMDNIYATVAIDKLKAGDNGTSDLSANNTLFTSLNAAAAVGDKAEAMKIGGGFSMDMFAVNAVVEKLTYKDASAGTDTKNTNIYVGGQFNLTGNDAIKAAVTNKANSKVAGVSGTDGARQLAVGFDHKLSKKATVYALYTKQNYKDAAAADPSDLSVGMKVEF